MESRLEGALSLRRVGRHDMADFKYDPHRSPIPPTWLALTESERIEAVRAYHHRSGDTHPPLHVTIHVVIENQAADPELPVATVLARFQREGLSRHDAIHAVGSVLAESLHERLSDHALPGEAANRRYFNALNVLTAKSWLAQADAESDTEARSEGLPPPARVGRNDPCPCGSGRKYKKCCGAVPRTTMRDVRRREWDDAIAALIQFAHRSEFTYFLDAAAAAFLNRAAEDLEDRAYADEQAAEQTDMAILLWSLYDLDAEPDARLVDLFLRRKARTLTQNQREFLEGMRDTSMRLYEVTRVYPEEGFDLHDLLDGSVFRVQERLGTRQIVPWDIVAGRARLLPGPHAMFEGCLYLYPRQMKSTMLRDLRRLRRTAPSARAFARALPLWFHWRWVELTLMRPLPTLVTAEGDAVVMTRSLFKVIDAERLAAALDVASDLERADNAWIWLESGSNRLLGTFRLEDDRLSVETFSHSRDRRACAFVTSLASSSVQYEGTTLSGPVSKTNNGAHDSDLLEITDPQAAEIVTKFHERYYREWVDTPVPALNGRTPRQAAADGRSRPKLVELLKMMENSTARAQQRGADAHDVSQLWAALGIPHPE